MTPAVTGLLLTAASAVLISFEFLLVKVFSFIWWGDFAYFIIAVAMFGFSLSGVLIAVCKSRSIHFSDSSVFWISLTTAVFLWGIPQIFLLIPLQPVFIFRHLSQFMRLFAGSVILGLPFLAGYFLIGIILLERIERIRFYYSLNLLGSAFGGVLFTFVLTRYSFPAQFKILAILFLLPLLLLRGWKYRVSAASFAVIIALMPFIKVNPSDFKDISAAKNVPEYTEVLERNTPYGIFAVRSSPYYRSIHGLSLNFSGDIGGQYLILQDGDIIARLPFKSPAGRLKYLEYLPGALPYVIRKPAGVLCLYTEGGYEWLKAAYFNAEEITVAISNGYSRDIVNGILNSAGYYGINPSSVRLTVAGARNFLEGGGNNFDLIEVSLTGPGAYKGGMRSNYILTAGGISACIKSLSPGGILSITTDIKNPPRIVPRMMNLFIEAGKRDGIDLSSRLLVYRGWNTATFLLSRRAFTNKEIKGALSFFDKCSLELVYFHGMTRAVANRHNFMPEPPASDYFDLSVPTDSHPFFYYFNPFFKAIGTFRENKDMAINHISLDEMTLFLTFVISVLLGLFFLVFPASGFALGQRKEIPFFGLAYFLAIGFGFLFVELLLIQTIDRFTGNYLISFIIVLTGMLVSAGAGSRLLTSRAAPFLFAFYIPLYLLIGFNVIYRLSPAFLFVVLALLGLLTSACMGVYFPAGMKLVQERGGALAPAWMWAFSGLASVIAPAAETLISIRIGFHAVFILTLLLYAAALAILIKKIECRIKT